MRVVAVVLALLTLALEPAQARQRHSTHHVRLATSDARPRAWCGWWLRHHLGIADRRLNLAWNWTRYYGSSSAARVGAIIVWAHHVGIITAYNGGDTATVLSGNDGHKVRERERSIRGAMFRS